MVIPNLMISSVFHRLFLGIVLVIDEAELDSGSLEVLQRNVLKHKSLIIVDIVTVVISIYRLVILFLVSSKMSF